MTWILGYLVIGMAFSVYMPWRMRRSLQSALDPHIRAHLSRDDRELYDAAIAVLSTKFTTAQLVIGGLTWPLQFATLLIANRVLRRHRP